MNSSNLGAAGVAILAAVVGGHYFFTATTALGGAEALKMEQDCIVQLSRLPAKMHEAKVFLEKAYKDLPGVQAAAERLDAFNTIADKANGAGNSPQFAPKLLECIYSLEKGVAKADRK